MDYIKVGVGVIIRDGNKILLGHRCKDKKDTGGIIGRDTWSLPGGKQEYDETFYEAGIREIKEETNLDITNLKLVTVSDDIGDDRHFITITLLTDDFSGELKVTEPLKNDEWKWFDIDNLPDNLYPPSKNSIKGYKETL
jgi:ADP-ribose pyrophosphatase YjhB (NUDIX family)